MNKFAPLAVALVAVSQVASAADYCSDITVEKIEAAQAAWGNGIVSIGASDDPKAQAMSHIDKFYGFDMGPVLFKPTKAAEDQFRNSKEEALSYFVGGSIAEDKGFALAPYTNVRFENEGMVVSCHSALAIGNYYFTTTDGSEVKVEYSFSYVPDANGNLKINLHHSSVPFAAN